MQGYYTLEEAANILNMATDQLSQMAQKREIRAFADRGTWRFRTQDVEETARRMGIDVPLSDAPPPKKRTSGMQAKPSSKLDPPGGGDIIGFKMDDDPAPAINFEEPAPPKKRTTGSKDKQSPGEEDLFEFELSTEGSMDLDLDSEMGYVDPTPPAPAEDAIGFQEEDPSGSPPTAKFKTSMPAMRGKTGIAGGGSGLRRTSIPPEAKQDSGVKLVGMDDEGSTLPADGGLGDLDAPLPADQLAMTEEMKIDDLDEELRKAEEASRVPSPSDLLDDPGSSPFELSESDLEDEPMPAPRKKTSGVKSAPPADDDDEVSLGDLSPTAGASGASGINLHLPADTGVNLEKSGNLGGGGDEVEFELSLDAESTPAPSSQTGENDSSEFELTLDDSGGLAPLDGESSESAETPSEEKDIFETDDNIPALDEESGSEAVALDDADTDLESSDFDFDPTAQEEDETGGDSGSQVVALDDDEEVSTAKRGADDEDELEGVGEIEEEEDEDAVGVGAGAAPAPWGPLPTIFLLPGVVVMFLLGLMTFELLNGMWGYKQPYKPTGLIIRPIAEMFGAEFPND